MVTDVEIFLQICHRFFQTHVHLNTVFNFVLYLRQNNNNRTIWNRVGKYKLSENHECFRLCVESMNTSSMISEQLRRQLQRRLWQHGSLITLEGTWYFFKKIGYLSLSGMNEVKIIFSCDWILLYSDNFSRNLAVEVFFFPEKVKNKTVIYVAKFWVTRKWFFDNLIFIWNQILKFRN